MKRLAYSVAAAGCLAGAYFSETFSQCLVALIGFAWFGFKVESDDAE